MAAANSNRTWFRYPTPEMIANLQGHKQISDENKLLILDHVSKANHPVVMQFHPNALKWKNINDPPYFRLYDNDIEPSWNEINMVRSYETQTIGYYNGGEIKRRLQSQFSSSRKYKTMAQHQDEINAKIKSNMKQDLSIQHDPQLINDSIENAVQFSHWLSKQQTKRRSKIKSYLMAERFNVDLTDLGLNNYCKNHGISEFALKQLSLPFPGFNDNMNICGARWYQAAVHTENLDADSYNLQTEGLKIWCIFSPEDSSKLEEYLFTGVKNAPFLTVKLLYIYIYIYIINIIFNVYLFLLLCTGKNQSQMSSICRMCKNIPD